MRENKLCMKVTAIAEACMSSDNWLTTLVRVMHQRKISQMIACRGLSLKIMFTNKTNYVLVL